VQRQPRGDAIARRKRADAHPTAPLRALIEKSLDDDKGEDIVVIDLAGKSDIADFMIIATGRSTRQVAAMAEHLRARIKAGGFAAPRVEGLPHADWVLVDAGDAVVHVFRPEVRGFYNLEKMWGIELPAAGEPAPTAPGPRGRANLISMA
jgi:ribosome-associated protein